MPLPPPATAERVPSEDASWRPAGATGVAGFLRHLGASWTWRMAWRDSRTSRRRLLLFSTSIILGIAALVAISSFGKSLAAAIDTQAKALLGADLVLAGRQAFAREEEALFQSIGGEQAREVEFNSMLVFPNGGSTRLVQVRGLDGPFPFYGQLEADPPAAAAAFREGGALVEETLLVQFSARVGDPIRLGELTTRIVGSLRKVPGETVIFATISPRVYLPMSEVEKTGLLRAGSLARHKIFFKLPPKTDVSKLVETIKPTLNHLRLAHNTVEMRKKDLGRSMDNLQSFLSLAGLIALLLGGVGVASAIHVHIKQKLDTVALLRCLGCGVSQTFAIYVLQGMALGMAGTVMGAVLGVAIQTLLPRVLADFLPFPVPHLVSASGVLLAMGQGFLICLLFVLLPLMSLRRVSPLAALRSSYENRAGRRDPWLWLTYALLGAGIMALCLVHAPRWRQGLCFAAGLGVAFAGLSGMARAIVTVAKRIVPASAPYVVRQGLANLHRPNNRTVLLMLSLGLGTCLILTLYLVHETLLTELISSRPGGEANLVLFDIQRDQRQGVAELIRAQNLQVLDEAPIVTMRLSAIKGRTIEELLGDKGKAIPNWVLRREYRSTYNDRLRGSEKIIAGKWIARVTAGDGVIPVSIEDSIAREMRVGLGDEIVFDLQGVPLKTVVASVREVDWRRVEPNFYFLFPRGVLEEAPAFEVLLTRVESAERSAGIQRAIVQAFPNVAAIDTTLVLQTLDAILGKISFAIRFMALFTVITGLLVLAGVILTGRYQRIRESVLLRTLGASRAQVLRILLVEYACLGFMAALTGIALALGASWALAAFVFHVRFFPSLVGLTTALVAVAGLTVVAGLLASRGVLNHPPLEILRAEV